MAVKASKKQAKKPKQPGDKKVKRRKSAPTQCTYIAKIAKKYLGEDKKDAKGNVIEKNPNKLTLSKSAVTEVEMLINHAVGLLVSNADSVLDYANQKTMGKSHVEVATTLALSGLLRDKALKAGSQAVINYNGYEPSAPPATNVLVEEEP
tara:strand:- start:109 stop:558 length:450 start_codon:yes stop_codon:yes gene_type:complete